VALLEFAYQLFFHLIAVGTTSALSSACVSRLRFSVCGIGEEFSGGLALRLSDFQFCKPQLGLAAAVRLRFDWRMESLAGAALAAFRAVGRRILYYGTRRTKTRK